MRLVPLVCVVVIVCAPSSLAAQEWIEYANRADLFTVAFPVQPTVTDVTYQTEYGLTLPGHMHSVTDGKARYSVTVIDHANLEKLHAARLEGCTLYPNVCANPWAADLRGALEFAAWSLMKREGKLTHFAYCQTDRVEGRCIQITNPDRSRTFGVVHMHENRLYILEGTVPAGAAPPGLFQQSLGFLDKNGVRVRYNQTYSNLYPAPTRVQY